MSSAHKQAGAKYTPSYDVRYLIRSTVERLEARATQARKTAAELDELIRTLVGPVLTASSVLLDMQSFDYLHEDFVHQCAAHDALSTTHDRAGERVHVLNEGMLIFEYMWHHFPTVTGDGMPSDDVERNKVPYFIDIILGTHLTTTSFVHASLRRMREVFSNYAGAIYRREVAVYGPHVDAVFTDFLYSLNSCPEIIKLQRELCGT